MTKQKVRLESALWQKDCKRWDKKRHNVWINVPTQKRDNYIRCGLQLIHRLFSYMYVRNIVISDAKASLIIQTCLFLTFEVVRITKKKQHIMISLIFFIWKKILKCVKINCSGQIALSTKTSSSCLVYDFFRIPLITNVFLNKTPFD